MKYGYYLKKYVLAAVTLAAAIIGIVAFFSAASVHSLASSAPNPSPVVISQPSSQTATTSSSGSDPFKPITGSTLPEITDKKLAVQKVIENMDHPTSMIFLDHGKNLLILEKNTGKVLLVSNGTLRSSPVLQVAVRTESERGLLGIAAGNVTAGKQIVYLYYTEDSPAGLRNAIYSYQWDGQTLSNPHLVFALPATEGPNHDGGKLLIDSQGKIYAVIGDLNRDGMLQNIADGPAADNTSVILKLNPDGSGAANALHSSDPATNLTLSRYYAYGVRNSFGLAIDPKTGSLWETENGPDVNDEINLVTPGFNSGWKQVTGPIDRSGKVLSDLVMLPGAHYSDPLFTWHTTIGVTELEFLKSAKLGAQYENNLFVGDINNGNLYYFTVNQSRTGLDFTGMDKLTDFVADKPSELQPVIFGTGFDGITDIKTGPDGFLYVLSYAGDLYRIVPAK